MRRLIAALGLACALVLIWGWAMGGFDGLLRWAALQQQDTQTALARALRALRAGAPGALFGFASVCFAYGFFHAIGPGHGKLVVGGYGLASRVSAVRLSLIALAGSILQGAMAVALVYAGITVLQATRDQITAVGDGWFASASALTIAAIGLWLLLRGALRVRRLQAHKIDADGHCHSCGHAHGPDPEAVAAATSWRATLAVIIGMGIRPCTGALFVLILGWRMQIELAAITGAFAMALGTASVTILVALGAVGLRKGVLAGLGESRAASQVAAGLEMAIGLGVALLALGLLTRAG